MTIPNWKNGFFVSLEGVDGAGKTTITELLRDGKARQSFINATPLSEILESEFIFSREPGGTEFSENIREMILSPENNGVIDDITEAYLYASSRANHVNKLIKPYLNDGLNVFTERFLDSSLVYQGYARGLGFDEIYNLNKLAVQECMPDLTICLLIPYEESLRRMTARTTPLDRLEMAGENFHRNVLQAWYLLKQKFPERIVLVDATKSTEEVYHDVVSIIQERYKIFNDKLNEDGLQITMNMLLRDKKRN